MKKLNDIKYGKDKVSDMIQLNKAQLANLNKDQLEGREPVHIRGIEGYVGGDGTWTSTKYIDKMKKEGKWQGGTQFS